MAGRFAPLRRGLVLRCPRCGARGLFRTYFELEESCPRCDYPFEREEGYWLGAMIVSIGVVEGLFGAAFVGGMVLTWPDVPWNLFLALGLAMNAILPVALYPWSKTVWMGVHTSFVPTALHDAPESHVPGGRRTGPD